LLAAWLIPSTSSVTGSGQGGINRPGVSLCTESNFRRNADWKNDFVLYTSC
jgi:hypothetical protein